MNLFYCFFRPSVPMPEGGLIFYSCCAEVIGVVRCFLVVLLRVYPAQRTELNDFEGRFACVFLLGFAWRTLCVGGDTCALPYSWASDLVGCFLLGDIVIVGSGSQPSLG